MQYDNIEKEIAMLNGWCKKSINKKAFVFATSKNVRKRTFCIARKHYGHIVVLSDWLTLPELEMYLYGIGQIKYLKSLCNSLPYGRNYHSGYDSAGITCGRIKTGILQDS